MKAIVQDRYGSPDVLELREIDRPNVEDDEVLVRVRAASVHAMSGTSCEGCPTSSGSWAPDCAHRSTVFRARIWPATSSRSAGT